MKQYWPMAKRKGYDEKLFTTTPCKDVKECSKVFKTWEYDYDIKEMWVEVTSDGRNVCTYDVHKEYVYTER